MIAFASTKRQQKRQRDALRAARRDKTLENPRRDEANPGVMRPRPAAAVMETAALGRLAAEPSARRCSPRELILPTPADQDLLETRALEDLDDRDLLENDPRAGPSLTVADMIRTFGPEYRRRHGLSLTVRQDRVLREMEACYTPLMGTHEWTCDDCGTVVELPNSCGNRHCPTCGDAKRHKWAETTASQILPVEYYHVILTVPRQITQLAMAHPGVLYPLMLRSGAEAIKQCGRKLFQAELALLSLLHTFGQLVNDHVHSHNLLPAGGLWRKGWAWIDLSREQIEELLVLVSTVFRDLFVKALCTAYDRGALTYSADPEQEGFESPLAFDKWLEPVREIRWIIRCPQVWDRRGMEQDPDATIKTIKYLASYANRVAVSNDRVVGIEGDQVLLRYKDYRDGDRWKTTSIDGVEFIGRFLRHLLPPGMHHIRRYGWMGRRTKNEKLTWLREYFGGKDSQGQEQQAEESQEDPRQEADEEASRSCRYCQGTMHLTNATYRPKVSEILAMPLHWFREARAGAIVTLGENVKDTAKLQATTGSRSTTNLQNAHKKEPAETGREQAPWPISAHL